MGRAGLHGALHRECRGGARESFLKSKPPLAPESPCGRRVPVRPPAGGAGPKTGIWPGRCPSISQGVRGGRESFLKCKPPLAPESPCGRRVPCGHPLGAPAPRPGYGRAAARAFHRESGGARESFLKCKPPLAPKSPCGRRVPCGHPLGAPAPRPGYGRAAARAFHRESGEARETILDMPNFPWLPNLPVEEESRAPSPPPVGARSKTGTWPGRCPSISQGVRGGQGVILDMPNFPWLPNLPVEEESRAPSPPPVGARSKTGTWPGGCPTTHRESGEARESFLKCKPPLSPPNLPVEEESRAPSPPPVGARSKTGTWPGCPRPLTDAM